MTQRERIEHNLEEGFGVFNIPEHMRDGVLRYVLDGIPMGSFGTALFANDLMQAFGRADLINRDAMFNWSSFIYNYVPATCHGSYEIVHAWKGITEPEPIDADPS